MPFTADEIANINNTTLKNFIDKGTLFRQNVQNKPMLDAFNRTAGSFSGGNAFQVSLGVKAGQGGGSLQGYSADDKVNYYNPATAKRVEYVGREHHIGMTMTFTELKHNGIEVVEDGTDQSTNMVDGREELALANILDEKNDELGEDYARSLDLLIHGDGTSDAKAMAGIQSLILANPLAGATGGLNRALFSWWRNRAATTAFAGAGGQGPITVNPANGGSLISFLDTEIRQLKRYARGDVTWKWFAGSQWIDGYKLELRANGYYSDSMSGDTGVPDGSMKDPRHAGNTIIYDPTLDDLGLSKRCYVIGMGKSGIQLLYFNGKRMYRHSPARPYDRYTMYNGITTTAVMVARQLNTSAVYDIA
ncbi:MAG: phage major capsid protein [Aquidulcibacter sp.]